MIGIILAAGAGRRLGSLTDGLPKCLLNIGDNFLLAHQASAMSGVGVREMVVVVGFKANRVMDAVKGIDLPVEWHFIRNPDFAETNTLFSLWLARDRLSAHDVLFANGDVLFDRRLTRRLLQKGKSTMAVERKRCGEEEVKVLAEEGRIVGIGKHIDPGSAEGEFVGVAFWRRDEGRLIAEALDECIAAGRRMDFFESAIDALLPETPFYIADVTDLPVVEIDFPEDLRYAQTEILNRILTETEDG